MKCRPQPIGFLRSTDPKAVIVAKLTKSFYPLTQKKGRFSDEALVVLMCFDIMGESQEETDEVIARDRKMPPYVEKYRKGDPKIAGRAYPDSLLKGLSRRKAISKEPSKPSSTVGAALGTILKDDGWRNILISLIEGF